METISERAEVPLGLMTTQQPPHGNPPRRRRVLVVADEADVARLVPEGWEVFTAGAGVDALVCVRDVRPDTVLLDVTASQFDGWEIYRRLKADEKTRAIPVIIVAGCLEEGARMLGSEVGADTIVVRR